MPDPPDHAQRRQQITLALRRVALRRGLAAASIREVAKDAGVSVRLVQYYFGTKEQLLRAALHDAATEVTTRFFARLRTLGPHPAPREVVYTMIEELLPTDRHSRESAQMFTEFNTAALTNRALRSPEYLEIQRSVTDGIATMLRTARQYGHLAYEVDTDIEAHLLVAATSGLGQGILDKRYTEEEARVVMDYALNRIFRG